MKWYIAARFGLKERVQEIQRKLIERGHTIVGDWISHKPIKPYDEHQRLATEYSIEDIDSVRESGVFLLLTDEAGTGIYTEFGVAIDHHLEHGKPLIYIVGDYTTRSMFYFHPLVNRRKNEDEVIAEVERINKH